MVILHGSLIYALDTGDTSPPFSKMGGQPFIVKYEASDYGGFNQNWDLVQDSLGILYFANGDGVLLYDGVFWKMVRLPNGEHVKSIAINKKGRIYVGSIGQLGYLQLQEDGSQTFKSLLPLLDSAHHNFGTVWSIACHGEDVFFSTSHDLLHFDGGRFEIYDEEHYDGMHKLGQEVYVDILGGGLKKWNGENFEVIFNANTIPGRIYGLVSAHDKGLLIFTALNGVFHYDEEGITKLPGYWDELRKYTYIDCVTSLDDGSLMVGTANGLFQMDRRGSLLHQFETDGLDQLSIHEFLRSYDGSLWVALDNGIAQVQLPSAFRKFDNDGQFQRCLSVVKFQAEIYGGFASGLHVLEADDRGQMKFNLVEGLNQKIWDLLPLEDRLFIAGESGIYIYDDDLLSPLGSDPSSFLQSKINPNRIIVSQAEGVISMTLSEREWILEKKYEGVTGSTYTILEEENGNIWLETAQNRIWKIEFSTVEDAFNRRNYTTKKYDAEQGVTDRGDIHLFEGNIYYVTASTPLLRYEPQIDKFIPDSMVASKFGFSGGRVLFQHIDDKGNVFFLVTRDQYYDPYVAWVQNDGSYLIDDRPAPLLRNGYEYSMERIDSTLWLGYLEYLVMQDLQFSDVDQSLLTACIHQVIYLEDSLIIDGPEHNIMVDFPYKQNRFRFKYGAINFVANHQTEYQVRLVGHDDEWSEWTHETQKDYTNLDGGTYSLEVRARDMIGRQSKVATFDFRVLAPWYRTWWAYLLWLVAGGLLLYAVSKWREKKLAEENLALQAIINERTATLQEQKEALAAQAEQLKEMDEIKSRFFANISHEFRTPLTLIKGPVDQALKTTDQSIGNQALKLIKKNADRLLQLVNQLLDLAKLDAKGLELNLTEGNIFQMLRSSASSFNSMAAQRNIDYQVHIPNRQTWSAFDHDKLEKIIYNLLSNAFKFTPDHGFVRIETYHGNDILSIEVSDSGVGISETDQDRIFNRFYQVEGGDTRLYPGTGVGLALTRELVQLMGGTIDISSRLNEGTNFSIQIPLEEIQGNGHTPTSTSNEIEVAENVRAKKVIPSEGAAVLLLVEDHLDMSVFLQQQLGTHFQIVTAKNGAEGFEKAVQIIPDLIVTDLMMPKMDGIEMTKLLKMDERTSHVPTIMLTAKAGTSNVISGIEAGADHYLTKPFEMDELRARINSLILQRKRLQAYFAQGFTIQPREIEKPTREEVFIQKVQELFEVHHSDPEFGVPGMMQELAMSKTQLHRKVKALTNRSPGELLRIFRIERAKQLLPNAENVSEVAYDVGFNNPSYFAKVFKDVVGKTPSEFINP